MAEALLPLDTAAVLAVALGCGLLIGAERERRKGAGPGRSPAGVRSFALASLLGAAAALDGQMWLMLVGGGFIAALTVAAYARSPADDPGITTEIALVITYVIGVTCTWSLPLAAALAVTVTGLLAGREGLHRFVTHWLKPAELRDGIVLGALALIALPLMPDRPLWQGVLNPRTVTTLLVLLLSIQALAHLCRRLMQARRAMLLSALASGFVSSTATIATLGMEVRKGDAAPRQAAGAALASCVATMLQLLAVAVAVNPGWLRALWLPALAGASVAALWAFWMVRGDKQPKGRASLPMGGEGDRMFSLRNAATVAALLTGIQVAVQALKLWLGDAGFFAGIGLSAIVDIHATAAAVLGQAPEAGGMAVTALMGALSIHAVSKCVTAGLSGGRAYTVAVAPGILGHTAVAVGLLAVQPLLP